MYHVYIAYLDIFFSFYQIIKYGTLNIKSKCIPNLRTQTALSEYIWDLKDEGQRYSVSWKVIERSQSFNPITLQCKLCLSEIVNILLNPTTQASLNKRSETYGFCRHRKKYLLAYSKPLAFKGGALTYRYKR